MLSASPEAVAPAAWAIAPGAHDMEKREGGRVSARREWTVAPVLEPARALPLGR
jgi:hypothetical protein